MKIICMLLLGYEILLHQQSAILRRERTGGEGRGREGTGGDAKGREGTRRGWEGEQQTRGLNSTFSRGKRIF